MPGVPMLISTALRVAFSRKVVPVSATSGNVPEVRSVTWYPSPSMDWISLVLWVFLVATSSDVGSDMTYF